MELLKGALPDIPEILLGQRFGLMWEQAIHAIADQERRRASRAGENAVNSNVFIRNLVDTMAGGVSAPVSPATRQALMTRTND